MAANVQEIPTVITDDNHALEVRDQIREFTTIKRGEAIRKLLNKYTRATYNHQHTPEEYMHWMNENDVSVERCHGQASHRPYFMCLFSVASQHVYGDSMEQCLDKAMRMQD